MKPDEVGQPIGRAVDAHAKVDCGSIDQDIRHLSVRASITRWPIRDRITRSWHVADRTIRLHGDIRRFPKVRQLQIRLWSIRRHRTPIRRRVDRCLLALTTAQPRQTQPKNRNAEASILQKFSIDRHDSVTSLHRAVFGKVIQRDATSSPKYRAIFMLAHGAGLRVGEITGLQVCDIDSERMLIHVREGKTGPRQVMLSTRVLLALRRYWKDARPKGPELFPGGRDQLTQSFATPSSPSRPGGGRAG